MSLESRANRASHGIRRSVAAVRPAGLARITRRHRLSLATAIAFVGILAGASVALAAMLPDDTDQTTTATETTAPATTEPTESTIPREPGPAIVVIPSDDESPDGEGTLPEGATVLVVAIDDLESLTGTGWDNWYFGHGDWLTTTTTEPEETTTTTTTTKPVVVTVTANQYYGPVSANPYEKIYGTAPPGTRVLLTSKYGSSDATVGDSGEYYLKVYFSGQPSDEYFPITATVGSKTFTFQFKWTGSYEVTANQYYGPENTERHDKVYGTAPPGTRVFATSDYGSSSLTVDSSGEYWLHIYFDETLPANQWITWTATLKDPSGTVLLTRTFDFQWVTTQVEVTANQKWGPQHGEPNEKIYGTAPPGSKVTVTSPYGSGSTTVDASGTYTVRVAFDDPPPNEAFTIGVTVAGQSFTFSFTYVVT